MGIIGGASIEQKWSEKFNITLTYMKDAKYLTGANAQLTWTPIGTVTMYERTNNGITRILSY